MTRRLAALTLLALALTGCTVPAGLHDFVNDGAKSNAAGNLARGEPTRPVLCAIGEDAPTGWLIPSHMVARYGSCGDAWRNAGGTSCTPVICTVLGDASTTPILQPDTPGVGPR